MANVGTAHLLIVPKFDNLSGSVSRALGGLDVGGLSNNISSAASKGITGGISAATVAVGNLISNAISAGVSMVTSHVDSAISRVDTLNNYPLVMQAFGVSADEATASIDRMSERLQNLPTKLDDMASTVQGLYAAGEQYGVSLETATEAGLALNDLLLAGGGSVQVVNSALEQFRQVLSKGKPDMQDWRSLMSAAPGQMNQLAHSMLGATATANDLYYALGGGKEGDTPHSDGIEYASISINELLDALIQLDEQGGDAFSSFADQAETAQGGIATSWANFGNAWTRGIAGTIEAFGRDNIVGVINEWKGFVKNAFAGFNDWLPSIVPTIMQRYEDFKGLMGDVGSYIGGVFIELTPVLERVGPLVDDIGEFALDMGPHIAGAIEKILPLAEQLFPLVEGAVWLGENAIEGIIDVAGGLGGLLSDGIDFVSNLEGGFFATEKLSDSMSILNGELETFGGIDVDTATLQHAYDRAREASDKARDAHADYLDELRKTADTVEDASRTYQTQATSLDYAYEVIERYGDKTGLTTTQQLELKNAVDKVNEACGLQLEVVDPLNGKISDGTTIYENAAEAIWDYIEAKKAEYRATALGEAAGAYESTWAAAINDYQAQADAVEANWKAIEELIDQKGSLDEALAYAKSGQYARLSTSGSDSEAYALNSAYQNYQRWIEAANAARDAAAAVHAASQTRSELQWEQWAFEQASAGMEKNAGTIALTSATVMNAFGEGGYKASLSAVDFAEALWRCADGGEALMDVLSNEDEMAKLVKAYDGTAQSLGSVFQQYRNLGITYDMDGWAKKLDEGTSSERTANWLLNLDDVTNAVMLSMGVSVDAMADSLSDAGVSVEDLTRIGEESFSELLIKAGGDLEQLGFLAKHFGETVPTIEIDGTVNVDTAQLYGANDLVAVWNGETLVDQATGVEVDSQALIDANGEIYLWNNSELKKQTGDVVVDTSGADQALVDFYNKWNNTTINMTASVSAGSGGRYVAEARAAGGFRTHADGAIVNKAAFLGDIVGEDGSEAIVPLSNRKYAQPFVDMLADGISKQAGSTTNITNVYIGESLVASSPQLTDRMWDFLAEVERMGGSNVG